MKKSPCIIDANFLAVYFFAEFAISPDRTPKLPKDDIAKGLKLLTNDKFPDVVIEPFLDTFNDYSSFITSSYIIHEVEHIINGRLKKWGRPQYPVFREGAEVFRNARAADEHSRYVEVVDLPASRLNWGNDNALARFNIADMSLIHLAVQFGHPVLTWDKPLREFIQYNLDSAIRLAEYSLKLQ